MAQEVRLNIDIEGQFKTSDYSFLQNEQCTMYFRLIKNHYVATNDDFTKLMIEFIDTKNSLNKFLVEASKSNIISFNNEKLVKMSLPREMTRTSTDFVAYPKININGIIKPLREFKLNIYQKDTAEMISVRKVIDEFNQSYANFASLIKKDLVGKPNGVAITDANNKVLESTLPPRYKEHVEQLIINEEVHGIRLNKKGHLEYKDPENNQWRMVKNQYDPTPSHIPPIINIKDSVVTVTYDPTTIISMHKWAFGEIANFEYFNTDGTQFVGSTFKIDKFGQYTLYYQLDDGRKFVQLFYVKQEHLKPPHTPPEISVSKGIVTVTHSPITKITQEKWAYGSQTVDYFKENGINMKESTFNVDKAGEYTVFTKLENGSEHVEVFNVLTEQLVNYRPSIWGLDGYNLLTWEDGAPQTTRWSIGKQDISYFKGGNIGNTLENPAGLQPNQRRFFQGVPSTITIYIKDEQGREFVETFEITSVMTKPPAKPTITGTENGTINVNFEYTEHVKLQKWEYEYQNLSYFSTGGNEFTGNSFITQKNGKHTICVTYDNLIMETYSFIMESMPDTIDIAVVGNIITIENEDYIVIDDRMVIKSKSVGEMKFDTVEIPESKYINYERPTNIGYYLDKTYYANLSQNLKESIEETNYNVAYNYNNAPQYKQYKVALITRELLFKHGNSVTNALKAHLQSNSTSRYEHWCGSTDSNDKRSTYNIKGGTLTTSTSPSSKERPFHPVFKLKSGTRVTIKK
ncbi:hypothetical protein ACIQ7N_01685 [Lysinibacillus sp. NPDC095746]|uniref:hypothetical protein n=1 Tax=Lysinibacillus sp. NPDC095746 TaxID=3364134 RepID=UPI0037FDC4F7